MDKIVTLDDGDDQFDVGGFFYTDVDTVVATEDQSEKELSSDTTSNDDVLDASIGAISEHAELLDAYDDFKIVSELRPTDVYVLQKLRNAVIVPTYSVADSTSRKIGAPILVDGESAREYSENLRLVGSSCFPRDSTERALEVIF